MTSSEDNTKRCSKCGLVKPVAEFYKRGDRKKLNGGGHVDHRHALANGGSNGPENLQLLCGSCNSAKRTKDEIDFLRERGFLI